MKLLSLIICFCFTFNVMASTGTVQELERALDEFNYSATVEWDQKDQAFMNEKTEEFYQTLAALMNKGLNHDEVINVVAKKLRNPKALEAFKLKVSLLADKANSPEELANILTQNSKDLYASGASWEGTYIVISVGVVLAFAALIAYSVWWSNNHTCVETGTGTQCGWVSQYQNGPQYYQCWETTVCTKYIEN